MDATTLREMRILAGIESGRPTLTEKSGAAPAAKKSGGWDPGAVGNDKPENQWPGPGGTAPDVHTANGWSRIALVLSDSNPGVAYRIAVRKLKEGSLEVGCNCKGWIRWHKPCKHIKAVMAGGNSENVAMTAFGKAWLAANKGRVPMESLTPRGIMLAENEADYHWYAVTPALFEGEGAYEIEPLGAADAVAAALDIYGFLVPKAIRADAEGNPAAVYKALLAAMGDCDGKAKEMLQALKAALKIA